ncbi:hypothetical protein QK289_15250, partial [Exiguobacterium antarcticum]
PKGRLAIHLPLSLRLEVGDESPNFDKKAHLKNLFKSFKKGKWIIVIGSVLALLLMVGCWIQYYYDSARSRCVSFLWYHSVSGNRSGTDELEYDYCRCEC